MTQWYFTQLAKIIGSKYLIRVGVGYDVHALVVGNELNLCGVSVPYPLGLDGHSDADVALHALCDALLGAAALGDVRTCSSVLKRGRI